jgi:serine/threonine protein kinase
MIDMELADRSLWDRFKECRSQGMPGIPREELLRYMEETAEALDLMNVEYQLQHLDIKPQNLFLVHNHVKVADFGLVKDLEGSHASITGGITPVYAAPETFEGNVTRFSDQYSLGIVFQELLTGQRPFNGTNVRQLILQHLQGTPNVNPLPEHDRAIILRTLSKTPVDRFPSCREFARALRNNASTGTSPSNQGLPPAPLVLTPTLNATVPHPPPDSAANPGTPPTSVPGTWQSPLTPGPASGLLTANVRVAPAPSSPGLAETPSSQGVTQNIRALDASILRSPETQTEQEAAPKAPPEITGPGTLFPSLIIGVGQVGLTVLQNVREMLHNYAAPLHQLPNLRFLLLDSDPDVMRIATRGQPAASLDASEVLIAPLNRPSHYVKPRDGRPAVESWLNPRMLFPESRVPRLRRGFERWADSPSLITTEPSSAGCNSTSKPSLNPPRCNRPPGQPILDSAPIGQGSTWSRAWGVGRAAASSSIWPTLCERSCGKWATSIRTSWES